MSRQTNSMSNLWSYKIVRFMCVGTINTLNDLAILNVLVFALHLNVIIANVVSVAVTVTISYFLNQSIVFKRQYQHSFRRFAKFAVVTGLSVVAVQSGVIYVLLHSTSPTAIANSVGITYMQAHMLLVNGAKIAAILAGMLWNYGLYHLVVFRHRHEILAYSDSRILAED